MLVKVRNETEDISFPKKKIIWQGPFKIRYLHGKGAQLEVSAQKALSLACSSKGRLRVFARTKLLQSGLLVKGAVSLVRLG